MNNDHPTHIVPGRYWRALSSGRVLCELCPRACQLDEGQKGFCFVRERKNDQMVLTAYGRTSGLAIDPIEKKPLYHFLPRSKVLSFGTVGCNLNCQFCQNWNLSRSRELDFMEMGAFPKDIANLASQRGIPSVAFTYNEPVVFLEYAVDVAKACHEKGIRTVAVTNGYIEEQARREFFQHMDAANIDLKGFTENFYSRVCGGKLESVLETLLYVKAKTKTWLEITNLIIPGENDSEKEISAMTQWIAEKLGPEVPLHFSAFHPDWKMTDVEPTPPEILFRARDIARKNGLQYVYTGNIQNSEGGTTFCSKCHQAIISRSGFQIDSYNLDASGHCRKCRTLCPGVFE